jgi:hypothetical protein
MWCLDYRLPEVAPNPTDGCGSPGGDSSDQAFVFHHVGVGVFVELLAAFSRLPLLSLSRTEKELLLRSAKV